MQLSSGPINFTKPLKWIGLSLCIKLILFFLFILPDNSPNRKFAACFIKSGDHSEYIAPIDNLFEKGVYALNNSVEPYAGRLPGFVFPYIIFRAIFSEQTANILLGVFILALAILASYILSLLLYTLTKKKWAFIIGFLLMNFTPYFWHYDWTLHTSSLGISCLIFFFYYFHKHITLPSKKSLLLAGLFLCWLVLLRGFCFFYLPIILLYLVYIERKINKSLKQIFISVCLFLLPLFIFESVWITRNFISLHKFVPLQTSFVPGADSKNTEYGYRSTTKYSLTKVRELIFVWGGDNVWYFPDSDFSWFGWNGDKIINHKFDESIFYENLTMDTLNALHNDVLYSYKNDLTAEQHDSIENKITRTSLRLKEKFIQDRKMYYYFYAPVKKLKNYLLRNITMDWPGESYKASTILQKGVKWISLLEYFILLFQIILFPFLLYKSKQTMNSFYLLFYVLVIATILPFLYIIPMAHYTYFIFGFVLLIPIFTYNVNALLLKLKR